MASGLTSIYLIPYPLSTDPVSVHGDMKLMADRLELVLDTKASKTTSNTFSASNIFDVTTSGDAVRITQSGTGNAFVVEDSSNPDSSAFVIDTSGNVAIGKTTASVKLDVVGAGAFSGAITGSTFNALTLTAAATGFTIAGGTTSKTLTINNTLSFSGTDSTVMTFPSTSQTIVGLTASQVLTNKSFSDSTTLIVDVTDNTKAIKFDIAGTTGITGIFQTAFTTAKTVTFQDVAGTVYVSGGTDVSLADGGTNASLTASNGGIVYSTATAMAILAGTATAGQHLQSGASGAPSWTTATFPSTATGTGTILRANGTNWVATTATYPTTTTANQILYSSAANTIAEITTANNQVLVTNGSGVPAFSATLPSGVTTSSLTSFGTSPTLTTPTIDTINVSGAAIAAALWNTVLTTGSISMGGALTTGGINIATGSAFNGTIAIGTGAGTVNKTINIGTSSTSGTTAISIGSTSGATSTISLNGTTTIVGDLTINGTTTTINSNTITVDDKNIELGSVVAGTISTTGTIGTVSGAGPFTATITGMSSTIGLIPGQTITATAGTGSFGSGVMTVASIVSATSITVSSTLTFTAGTVTNILGQAANDTTANGGGITLKGTTDKTITWDGTNWTSNQPWNITSGNTFKINNTSVLSSTAVLGLTPTVNATGYTLSGGTTAVAVTFAGGAAYTLSGTNGQTYTFPTTGGTLLAGTVAATSGGTGQTTYATGDILYASATNTLSKLAAGTNGYILTMVSGVPAWTVAPSSGFTNPMTTLGDTIYGGASGTATRLAGPAVNGIYFLRENVTASASVAPDWIGSTGSGNVVLATSPTIAGGGHTGITSLGIRDTSAAFDVTIAATSNPVLTAARILTINMQDAARTISLAGNLTLGGTLSTASSFTTSGVFALTLTATNTTNATIPAGTVTLVDLSTSQALTNKTISGLTVSTTTGTLTIPAATIAFSGANATTITTTGTTTVTLPTTGTLAANVTTTIGDIIYASATGTPGTLARLAGNTATQPSFLTSTGNGTANTTTSFTTSTGSGSVVLGTSPTIATPQLSLETTSRTTEGSMSWDPTYDFLRIGNATVAKSFFPFDVNTTAKAAAYQLTTADANTVIQMNGAFAFQVDTSLAVLPAGTTITLVALTAGVTVATTATATVPTIYATPGLKLRAQYSTATLIKLSASSASGTASTWLLTGDLTA